jgi:predicted site-specific integrase-resolvase
VLTAAEAGKILGVCDRTVLTFAKQGLLRRVKYPGRKQAGGFRYSDVAGLLERSVE